MLIGIGAFLTDTRTARTGPPLGSLSDDTRRSVGNGFPDAEQDLVAIEICAGSRSELELDSLERERGRVDDFLPRIQPIDVSLATAHR